VSAPDEMDLKILDMLEKDGRMAFTDIARELGVNEATVRKRVLGMQVRGVIRRFSVVVDHGKLGMNTVAIVGIEADPAKLLDIAQKLCDFKELKCVATSTGDHMIMTEVWTRNGLELTRLISDKIGKIDGVKRICPALILEKLKD